MSDERREQYSRLRLLLDVTDDGQERYVYARGITTVLQRDYHQFRIDAERLHISMNTLRNYTEEDDVPFIVDLGNLVHEELKQALRVVRHDFLVTCYTLREFQHDHYGEEALNDLKRELDNGYTKFCARNEHLATSKLLIDSMHRYVLGH